MCARERKIERAKEIEGVSLIEDNITTSHHPSKHTLILYQKNIFHFKVILSIFIIEITFMNIDKSRKCENLGFFFFYFPL